MCKWGETTLWGIVAAIIGLLFLAPFSKAQDGSGAEGLGAAGQGMGFKRFRQGSTGGMRNFAFLKPQGIEGKWSGRGKPLLKELVVEGVKRRYYLYKPDSATLPAALVLAFHGGGGTAEGTDKAAGGLAKLADEKGFVVAFPDAMDRHWNDGRPDLSKTNYDDVGFISKLIDDLQAERLIDPRRVYATGISNGGFFSQYLAIQLPQKIAAIATVAASVSKTFLDLKVTPVPIMMLLGTKDTLVPWDGGKVGGKVLIKKRGEVLPGRQSLQFWLDHNQNTAKPVETEIPDRDPGDGCRVSVEQYGAPGSNNEVVLYEIQGGGHTWPAGQQYLPKSIVGPVCRDFEGNTVIWNFFEKHALR